MSMDSEIHIAHIREEDGAIQTVKEHSENTAALCKDYAIPEMKALAEIAAGQHDDGKYQNGFQKRIRGQNIRIEHSTCGALVVDQIYQSAMGLMMRYCIVGHHSGIPDGGQPNDPAEKGTLYGRMKRKFEPFDAYQQEIPLPEADENAWIREYLIRDCGNDLDKLIDKFAFLTRYLFSCLVDADSIDTARFCHPDTIPRPLRGDFTKGLERVNAKLDSFVCETKLQQTRARLQKQAFQNALKPGEIFLLSMPTGSGKTLASVKIALERAIAGGKKRIIYIIPYNSIIDQTSDEFEKLFKEDIELLRHQSSFSFEDRADFSEDYREAAKNAVENWDAPLVLTTAVQFFESIYSNKRGKLRKLHNMAESILVFDEAHLMPVEYLQPCLQAVSYITKYLHSEAIFLTATMPDFSKLIKKYALPNSNIQSLICDTSDFAIFRKCRFQYIGELEEEELLSRAKGAPSALYIVNRKAMAKKLYKACTAKVKYHLSTYMTAYDRREVLQSIREALKALEEDFPDGIVPEERQIRIFSTSLIEAGVDIDVHTVFRETAGLDSILQAGGRCNREGKRANADVYVFEFNDQGRKRRLDVKTSLAKGKLQKYPDISAPECIKEYYDELFAFHQDLIESNTMHKYCNDIHSIPFASYAQSFEMIDSRAVSLVVERDEVSRQLVAALRSKGTCDMRRLQMYTCSLYPKELESLIQSHAADDFGTGIYCLTNSHYYEEDTGIQFEATDYIL